jgi:hypothetical protein
VKPFSSRIHLLLVLPILCTTANLKCIANPGDLITHTTTHSTVSKYYVTGWQNKLTSATPNLHNYYWEPMTKRVINTTRTTSRGAICASPIVPNRSSRHVSAVHVPLPVVNQGTVAEALPQTSTKLTYSTTTAPVLSYSNTSLKLFSNRGAKTDSPAAPARQESSSVQASVYGVLKTARSLRATPHSL